MKILKNAAYQLSSKILTKFMGFFAFTWTVHYLGVNGFGRYSYVTTFVSFFAIFSDMGLNANLFKDASKNPDKAGAQLSLTLMIEALILPLLLVGIAIAAYFMEPDRVLWLFIMFAALGILSRVFSQAVMQVLNGRELFHISAALDILESVCNLLIVGAVVLSDFKISGLLLGMIIKNMLIFLAALFSYLYTKGRLHFYWNIRQTSRLVWLSFPFVIIGSLNNLYQQVDIIMLKQMTDFNVVGAYGAAYKLLTFVFMIGATLAGVIFPRLAQKSHSPDKEFFRFYGLAGRMLAYVALGLTMICVVAGQNGIEQILGRDFDYGGQIFVVLALSIVINFLALIPTYTLMATDALWTYAGVYIVSVLVNVVINIYAIPRWNALGAAWATNITELATLYVIYWLVSQRLKTPHLFGLNQLASFGTASVLGVGAALLARHWSFWLSIPVFGLLFVCLMLALRVLNVEDKVWLRQLGQTIKRRAIG